MSADPTRDDHHMPGEALCVDQEELTAELLEAEGYSSSKFSPIRDRAPDFATAASMAAELSDEVEAILQAMDAIDETYAPRKQQIEWARDGLQARMDALKSEMDELDQATALLEERQESAKRNHRWSFAWRMERLDGFRKDFAPQLKLRKSARSLTFPNGTLTFYQNATRKVLLRDDNPSSPKYGERDDPGLLQGMAVLGHLGLYDFAAVLTEVVVKVRATELSKSLHLGEFGRAFWEIIVTKDEVTQELVDAANAQQIELRPGAVNTATGEVQNWIAKIPAEKVTQSEGGDIVRRQPLLVEVPPEEPYTLGWKRADPTDAKEATDV